MSITYNGVNYTDYKELCNELDLVEKIFKKELNIHGDLHSAIIKSTKNISIHAAIELSDKNWNIDDSIDIDVVKGSLTELARNLGISKSKLTKYIDEYGFKQAINIIKDEKYKTTEKYRLELLEYVRCNGDISVKQDSSIKYLEKIVANIKDKRESKRSLDIVLEKMRKEDENRREVERKKKEVERKKQLEYENEHNKIIKKINIVSKEIEDKDVLKYELYKLKMYKTYKKESEKLLTRLENIRDNIDEYNKAKTELSEFKCNTFKELQKTFEILDKMSENERQSLMNTGKKWTEGYENDVYKAKKLLDHLSLELYRYTERTKDEYEKIQKMINKKQAVLNKLSNKNLSAKMEKVNNIKNKLNVKFRLNNSLMNDIKMNDDRIIHEIDNSNLTILEILQYFVSVRHPDLNIDSFILIYLTDSRNSNTLGHLIGAHFYNMGFVNMRLSNHSVRGVRGLTELALEIINYTN